MQKCACSKYCVCVCVWVEAHVHRGIEMWYCVFKKPADWYCKHGQKADSWDNRPPGSLKLGNPNSDIHRLTPPLIYICTKIHGQNKQMFPLFKCQKSTFKYKKSKVKSLALLSAKETDGEGKHYNKTSTRKKK